MKTSTIPIALLSLAVLTPSLAQTSFTMITEGPHVTELGSSGFGAWGDYDHDGYPDLYVFRYKLGTSAIYRNNRDGTFSRLPEPAGLAGTTLYGSGWCDWDNDGNQDLYAAVGEAWRIGYGDGQGDFVLGSASLLPGRWSTHADFDRDGLVDGYWSGFNCLHHNQGNREFTTYLGQDLGPAGVNTYGGVCAGDFDDDGWPDLYVPSKNQSRSYLFRNDRNGHFVAVTNLVTQTAGPAFQGGWGDYDNDGRLDLFVACFNGTSRLYRNLGDGQFECPPGTPTLTGTRSFVAWADYDNDGFLDLWVSGYLSGNKFFRNNGDGSFAEVTSENIVTERPLNNAGTYQVVWFDYDNDGSLDLYLMNADDNRSIWTANQLFRNNGNQNAWLTVRLIGTVSNRDAVGAKVRVRATYAGADRWQRRDISGGVPNDGNHQYAHFGLGDATNVTTLRIEWPSGIVQELANVAVNQILTITEPAPLVPLGCREFQIRCWHGMRFEVDKSHDLQTWNSLGTVTNLTGTLTFQDTQSPSGTACCFYRAVSR